MRYLAFAEAARLAGVKGTILRKVAELPPLAQLPGGEYGWQEGDAIAVRDWCYSVSFHYGDHCTGPGKIDDPGYALFDPLGRSGEYSTSDAVLAGVSPADIMRAATPGGALPLLQELACGSLGWPEDVSMAARTWCRRWIATHGVGKSFDGADDDDTTHDGSEAA
ncbi:MAG TPA: hypothetical protein VMV69_08775 [Pirellulales bacterium]|nr:hypothetical protein [Pirellulales bacterium]